MISEALTQHELIELDLSENSPIAQQVSTMTIPEFSQFLFDDYLLGRIGIGGYLELRDLYKRSHHFYNEKLGEYRTVHLGIDVWMPAGTKICCPVEAFVHSVGYNDNPQDYGGTVILLIEWKGEKIHLLFGHLSSEVINKIQVGQQLKKHEIFAELGDMNENGGWPPHLHIQLIRDLEGNQGDYPGTCCPSEILQYKENCPNPIELVVMDY